MKIVVLGVTGLIGSTVYRILSDVSDWQVYGTMRQEGLTYSELVEQQSGIIGDVDALSFETVGQLIASVGPDVVVNCIGLTKHKAKGNDPLACIALNSLMPHKLALVCRLAKCRLIHISTDCVFSGRIGNYSESDVTDAIDVYGKSKALGELHESHTVTLRTSTIGHEERSKDGLLEWFLSQRTSCTGYSKAIFSGLPTIELAIVIRDFVIPNTQLSGLYNVAAEAVNKYELLSIITKSYGKSIIIEKDDKFTIDRSLDASKFFTETGYQPASWENLIQQMHTDMKMGFYV
jgi:dTDP-4-dehydrorhamnose reductase